MCTKLAHIKKLKKLNIGTDRPVQTVLTQIRCRRGQRNETNLDDTCRTMTCAPIECSDQPANQSSLFACADLASGHRSSSKYMRFLIKASIGFFSRFLAPFSLTRFIKKCCSPAQLHKAIVVNFL